MPAPTTNTSASVERWLVNARQLHGVPGRKTDVRDCQWLQILHSHGLLRGSFRPSEAIVGLRALHRQQANFVQERTRLVQWMQKALDQMNVQVHRAVTDLTGETGMAIIRIRLTKHGIRLTKHVADKPGWKRYLGRYDSQPRDVVQTNQAVA